MSKPAPVPIPSATPPDPDPATVAITGAGGNVGSIVADAFRRRGRRIALVDSGRNLARLREMFPSEPIVAADLTDPVATARAIDEIRSLGNGVGALVHLAGGFATAPVVGADGALLDRMLDRNLRTLDTIVRAVLPDMLERRRGVVLGVAARQALEGGRHATAYSAAKAAVLGYLRALRAEVGRAGIAVGAVVPMGTIDTPENRAAMPQADPAGWITAQEMADALVYLSERTPRGRVRELRVEAMPLER